MGDNLALQKVLRCVQCQKSLKDGDFYIESLFVPALCGSCLVQEAELIYKENRELKAQIARLEFLNKNVKLNSSN